MQATIQPTVVQPTILGNNRNTKAAKRRHYVQQIERLESTDNPDVDDQKMVEAFERLAELAHRSTPPARVETFLHLLASASMTTGFMPAEEARELAQQAANFLMHPVEVHPAPLGWILRVRTA